MVLELASNGLNYTPYVWVPNIQAGGGVYCREDKFDAMSESDYDGFMEEIFPYQMEDLGLSENENVNLLAGFKSRRTERRAEKSAKRAAKTDNKKSKADKRRMKGEAKKTRAQAKQDKANQEGGDGDGGSKGMDVFNKLTDTAQSYFNKDKGADGGGDGDGEGDAPDKKKKSNTTLWIVGSIAGVFVLGTIIYVSTRPKKVA